MAPVPEEGEHDGKPPDINPVDNIAIPDVFIDAEQSDSEDEDDDFQGYQMLPQEPEDDEIDENDNDIDNSNTDEVGVNQIDEAMNNSGVHIQAGGGTPSYMQVPDLPKPDPQSLLWNQKCEDKRIQLDAENAEKIKSLMKKIQLPQTNIPDWAKNIPEDQWRQKIEKIQNTNS